MRLLLPLLAVLALSYPSMNAIPARAEEALPYQKAPAPLDQMLEAPFLPAFSLSPDRRHYLLMQIQTLPELADLAAPEMRLAGLRINPANYSPSRNWSYTGVTLQRLDGTRVMITGLPAHPRLANFSWSPDGRHVAFTQTTPQAVELWVLDVNNGRARHLSAVRLNKTTGSPLNWAPDGRSLLIKAVVPGSLLPSAGLPQGPVVYENDGSGAAPGRTYQDLLTSPADAARFRILMNAQLERITLDGKRQPLGQAAMITAFSPSPDGRYVLVKSLREPFSYMFPASRFPQRVEVWDAQGKALKIIADLPLANRMPIHADAVRTGLRQIEWRPDQEASLTGFEALDGGDPRQKTPLHDRLWSWAAPFADTPRTLLETPYRLEQVDWGGQRLALARSAWYDTRQTSIWLLRPDGSAPPREVQRYSSENRYAHPGTPLLRQTPGGAMLWTSADGESVFLSGEGASEEGNQPFLDRWHPAKGQTTRIWRSQPPMLEQPVEILDPEQGLLITRREAQDTPPNYFVRGLVQGRLDALTQFPHPMPELMGIQKQVIQYTRADGVPLSGTLYLPPGYTPAQGPLPTVLWAYPREFKNSQAAGQVKGSLHSFVRLSPWSPLVFLTQGYAVLDDPAMPIVGEGSTEPNDTYVKQLVQSAEAAVNKLVEMGVSEKGRLAIGGHSYGAFMTANLLAHSDLFATGIARSGAYNRTLTPFGFQSEQRTLWEAPEVYLAMSPLLHAQKIRKPLLLIHGEADNNSGTYPMQSQNFYQALKGLGAPVRLVMLPYESHRYEAQESLNHVLWEMVSWLDKHLKAPAKP